MRRIVGITALTVFVLVYILVAMAVGAIWFIEVNPIVQLVYFIVAGVAWTLPAAGIITWMRRQPGTG
jgi:hypothetical protein